MRPFLMVLFVGLLLASCSQAQPEGASTGSTTSVASATGSAVGPPAPSPGPVPAELTGVWQSKDTREKLSLEGEEFRFYIHPSSYASGQVLVESSRILFTGSTDCPGDGLYEWTLTGETLHFASVQPDPCPRATGLNGKDWVLVHH